MKQNRNKWAVVISIAILSACNTSDPMPRPALGNSSSNNQSTNNIAVNNVDPNNSEPVVEGDIELLEPTTAAVYTNGSVMFRATSSTADRIVLRQGANELGEFAAGTLEFDASALAEGVETVVSVVALSPEGDDIGRAEVSITLDQTAPTIVSFEPAEGATDAALRAPLVVSFSESISDLSVSANNAGESVDVEWEAFEDGTVQISVVEPQIIMPAEIAFEIDGFTDRAGNVGDGLSHKIAYEVWQKHSLGANPVDFATATGFADLVVTTERGQTVLKQASHQGWVTVASFSDGPEYPVAERIDADSVLIGGIAPNATGSMAFRSWIVTGEDVAEGPSFAVGDSPLASPVQMVTDDMGAIYVGVASSVGPIVMKYNGDSFGPHGAISRVTGYRTDDIALATDGDTVLVTFPVCTSETPTGCNSLIFETYRLDGTAERVGDGLASPTDDCTGRTQVASAHSGTDFWMATWTSTCSQQVLRAYRYSDGRWIPTFDAQQQGNLAPPLAEVLAQVELFGAGGAIALGVTRPAGASVRLFNAMTNGWTPEIPVTFEAGESFTERSKARFDLDEWASPIVAIQHGGAFRSHRFNK